jgi:glutamyl/glutaminyl-tRNA synthetase
VQQVTSFKLLGVTMNDALKWDDHIAAVTSKAAKRLWFLKKLKRAGVSQADLVYYYQAVIRPVLEYACPVWHTSITDKQSKQLDLIQRRACQIIVNGTSYVDACTILGLSDLKERRQQQCKKLFDKLMNNNNNCLSYLLPEMRDVSVTSRLRSANKLPLIFAKTSKFKNSFICYGLSHYQSE